MIFLFLPHVLLTQRCSSLFFNTADRPLQIGAPAFIKSLFFDTTDRPLQIRAPVFIRSSTLHIVPLQIGAPSFLFSSSSVLFSRGNVQNNGGEGNNIIS